MSNTANITQLSLDRYNLVQGVVAHRAIEANSVIEGQADVERKALEVSIWVNVVVQLLILEQLVDAGRGLQINEGEVGLHSLSVESRGSSLSRSLDGLAPRGCSEGIHALSLGNNAVERPELGARDEGRLVLDPEFPNRFKGVCIDEPL